MAGAGLVFITADLFLKWVSVNVFQKVINTKYAFRKEFRGDQKILFNIFSYCDRSNIFIYSTKSVQMNSLQLLI